jgi:hypothetical protein
MSDQPPVAVNVKSRRRKWWQHRQYSDNC